MTTSANAPHQAVRAASLGEFLGLVHKQWIRRTHSALDPAMRPGSSLWDRWTAARYLGDQFEPHFRRERNLIDGLRSKLTDVDARTPPTWARWLDAMHRESHLLGRRQDTAREMAQLTGTLRGLVEHWCRQVEVATGSLRTADLGPAAVEAVDELLAGAEVPAPTVLRESSMMATGQPLVEAV